MSPFVRSADRDTHDNKKSSPLRPQTATGNISNVTDPKSFFSSIFHYDGNARKVLAFYAEPKITSERLGCVYPGDDLSVVEILVDASGDDLSAQDRNTWYKLSFADFDDGSYHSTTKDSSEIKVFVPRYWKGQQVVFDGPFDGETQGALDDPPGETIHFSRNYKITGSNGVLVRQSSEISSPEVCTISLGEDVHATEETFNSEGTLRLKIDRPVSGYISKLMGLVERLPDSAGSDNTQVSVLSLIHI